MLSSRDAKITELWLRKQRSSYTRWCYQHDSERLLEFVGKPLARITLGDFQNLAQFLAGSGLAPISRARSIAAVKSLFGFAHRMRFIAANPAAELSLPPYENRLSERILVEQDIHRMLATETHPRDKTLLRLLYTAGLRVSEACQLRWRNLHARGDAGQITVFGKNGRTRAIALPAEVSADLARRRGAPEELVFPSRSGKALDRGRVRVILRRAAERAGVTEAVSPHWLRHAHASHALDRGAPIHLVQATLGHSSVATTSRYLHARPGDSSARFLAIGVQSRRIINLPVRGTGVMNLLTGPRPAKGDYTMMICSVAVDLRISNVVDVPNYVVSALLPEEIFSA